MQQAKKLIHQQMLRLFPPNFPKADMTALSMNIIPALTLTYNLNFDDFFENVELTQHIINLNFSLPLFWYMQVNSQHNKHIKWISMVPLLCSLGNLSIENSIILYVPICLILFTGNILKTRAVVNNANSENSRKIIENTLVSMSFILALLTFTCVNFLRQFKQKDLDKKRFPNKSVRIQQPNSQSLKK